MAELPSPASEYRFWCWTCMDYVETRRHHTSIQGGASVQCPSIAVRCDEGIPRGGIMSRVTPEALKVLHDSHLASAPGTGENLPVGFRDRIAFSFTDCRHVEERIIEIETELGVWGLAICQRCGHVNTKECPHVKTQWDERGTLLYCLNCGVDCT